MMNNQTATLIRSLIFGAVCTCVGNVSAQEPIELPLPGDNPAIEEIAASPEKPSNSDAQQDEFGYETLTRGPLHEAFAEPFVADPAPGLIVSQEPPQPINELPPEFRPEGEDAIWIAGYWGWDDQREDFVWISGVYRVPPVEHQWIPGYWHQVNEGWQWVQGFWVEDVAESIAYLPPPPATLENGPSSPSPGVDYFYVPGNWAQDSSTTLSSVTSFETSSSGYVWNAGYWHPMQDDLVWIPARAVWTPRGCVYVNGYWDQRLPLRGLCFAPVYIPRTTYSRPGWSLRPNVVLNAQSILHNLFVQPRYNHYVFGDYYGLPLGNRRAVPAYVYHQSRGSYDPLISFYSAYNARQGQDMIRWYGNQYADLSRNPSKRPPQIWTSDRSHSDRPYSDRNPGVSNREPNRFAHTLDQVNSLNIGQKISPVNAFLQQEIVKRDLDRKRFAKEREENERIAKPLEQNPIAGGLPPNFKLPKSEPVVRRKEIGGVTPPSRTTKLPEQPRNSNRSLDRNNREDRNGRDSSVGQSPRRLEPNAKDRDSTRFEPKDLEQSLLKPNRISNPLDTNRVLEKLRQSEQNKVTPPQANPNLPNLTLPLQNHEPRRTNIQPNQAANPIRDSRFPGTDPRLPKNENRLPNSDPRPPKMQNAPPNGENRIFNNDSRIPKIEDRKPIQENRTPKIEPRFPNSDPRIQAPPPRGQSNETRQPANRPSQPNRIQSPNEDRPKPNRGNGPLDGFQGQTRGKPPVQPIVRDNTPPPKVQGNNASNVRPLRQPDRQPPKETSQTKPPSQGRRNSGEGDSGKKSK